MFKKIRILLDMIKFEHTLFALPFAFLGAFLAARGVPSPKECWWIFVAMAGARTCAMGFNRIVDVPFDAQNPRTRDRALPSGKARVWEAWIMVIIAAGLYFLAAFELNMLAFKLSPIVLAVVLFYSYTKRFTPLCHLFLGLAIGIAPTAGWIAVKGSISYLPIILTIGVMFWVGGFDILYACLDEEFDKKVGLHSIPARFGRKRAFWISGFFHAIAFSCFVAIGILAGLNWIYYAGIVITFILLIMQRIVVTPSDISRMNMAFFTLNGAISIVLFAATALALMTS